MDSPSAPEDPVARSTAAAGTVACAECGRPIWPRAEGCPWCARRAQAGEWRPPPLTRCADCGRPVSATSRRCRACDRLARLRHHTIVRDCPFPRGDPDTPEPRVLTPAERWWIRTAGTGYSARALAEYFGVHPTTIGRIRGGEHPEGDEPGSRA